MKRFWLLFFLIFIFIGIFSRLALAHKASLAEHERIAKEKIIKFLSTEFDKKELESIFNDKRLALDPTVAKKGMTGAGFDYFDPEFQLLDDNSIQRGLDCLSANKEVFDKVFEEYSVEPEFIAAILRIETDFGIFTGKRPVINSLYSWYVLSPRRRPWALKELKAFLKIAKNNQFDVFSVLGSTAGAFGLPQFLPSSYLRFGVDGNKDGKVDLFHETDTIASVANYLKSHGWGKSEKEKRKAIYGYNHSQKYVDAVVAYAKELKKKKNSKK